VVNTPEIMTQSNILSVMAQYAAFNILSVMVQNAAFNILSVMAQNAAVNSRCRNYGTPGNFQYCRLSWG